MLFSFGLFVQLTNVRKTKRKYKCEKNQVKVIQEEVPYKCPHEAFYEEKHY